MGNQAALSGLSGVPQGRLFGADGAVNVCKGISKERCMVLSDASKHFHCRFTVMDRGAGAGQCPMAARAFLFIKS